MSHTTNSRIARWAQLALPLFLFLLVWHLAVMGNPRRQFFLGSPREYVRALLAGLLTGSLVWDTMVTGAEAAIGFLAGNCFGAIGGFMLWKWPSVARVLKPYITTLGSAPLFAFAPIIVLWFGIGFFSKVVVATCSTIFVALMQAFNGAQQLDMRFAELVRSFGGDQETVFRKVVVPSSLVWVIAGFQLNVGLALLGAFLGEYISSKAGLGHIILVAGGLYNIPLVLVAVTMIGLLGLFLSWCVGRLGRGLSRRLVAGL